MNKKILILGSSGQLGKEFKENKILEDNFEIFYFSKKECDISDFKKLLEKIENINPSTVINCAAYTDVDAAESNKHIANKVNNIAVENLSNLSNKYNFLLVHFSTDYVFDGAFSISIDETVDKNPINYYGKTKHLGEEKIIKICKKFLIFRVSWVYGMYGNNFPKKIINMARSNEEIKVVDNQYGTPTSTRFITYAINEILKRGIMPYQYGVYHLSPSGSTSWYEFAKIVHKKINVLSNANCVLKKITAINSSELKTSANRPNFSILDNTKLKKTFKIKTLNWDKYFDNFIKEIKCKKEKV